ncbi:MAG: hypothetical protein KIT09_20615 [Bryobacteraceae bacterium]|nr:hypothetical protein [Bryobacteraceae bacterium]
MTFRLLIAASFASVGCISAQDLVTVFLDFDHPPSGISFAEMKREAATVIAAAGLAVEWKPLPETQGVETFSRLAVLRFRGRCDSERRLEKYSGGDVLGLTNLDGNRVLPFGEILCDAVREWLAAPAGAFGYAQRAQVYGRALGRVVAHELYHIFGNTLLHDLAGIAKATQSGADLRSRRARLEAPAAQRLRGNVNGARRGFFHAPSNPAVY